jgi:hypothetical protein
MTADRTSGCRNAGSPSAPITKRPVSTAGPTLCMAYRAERDPPAPPPSSAARSNSWRVCVSSGVSRDPKMACSRSVSVIVAGAFWDGCTWRGSSSRASGLPAACSSTARWADGAKSNPLVCRNSAAAASPSGRTSSCGQPAAPSTDGVSDRQPATRRTCGSRRRCAVIDSTAALRSSNQCASSTTISTGSRRPARTNRSSSAVPIASIEGGEASGPASRPRVGPSAGASNSASRSRSGRTSWLRPASGIDDSNCTPPARCTRHPSAAAVAQSSSSRAVLPTPASPRSISAPWPAVRKRRSAADSPSRPNKWRCTDSTAGLLRPTGDYRMVTGAAVSRGRPCRP